MKLPIEGGQRLKKRHLAAFLLLALAGVAALVWLAIAERVHRVDTVSFPPRTVPPIPAGALIIVVVDAKTYKIDGKSMDFEGLKTVLKTKPPAVVLKTAQREYFSATLAALDAVRAAGIEEVSVSLAGR